MKEASVIFIIRTYRLGIASAHVDAVSTHIKDNYRRNRRPSGSFKLNSTLDSLS